MAEVISQAERLRRQIQARRDNAGKQVKKETRLNKIVSFLNDKNGLEYVTVEDMYPKNKQKSQIVSAFEQVIKENDFADFVGATNDDDHVYLTLMMTRQEIAEYFENEENGEVEENESGVEVEAN